MNFFTIVLKKKQLHILFSSSADKILQKNCFIDFSIRASKNELILVKVLPIYYLFCLFEIFSNLLFFISLIESFFSPINLKFLNTRLFKSN